jgi:hypothetical protein
MYRNIGFVMLIAWNRLVSDNFKESYLRVGLNLLINELSIIMLQINSIMLHLTREDPDIPH